nr:MAG TPA: hypothetical protein [Caudoviricetes sp.]
MEVGMERFISYMINQYHLLALCLHRVKHHHLLKVKQVNNLII